MSMFTKAKQRIGHHLVQEAEAEQQPVSLAQSASISTIIQRNPEMPVSTTNMSREALKARRMARVEQAQGLVEHFHVTVMLKYLDGLLLVVPFLIIFLTTSEVGQLFTGKAFNPGDQTSLNMYGAALLAECVYAGTTFIWQYANGHIANLENGGERQRLQSFARGIGVTWALFSAISALGQYQYLHTMWHPASTDFFTYALIVARVAIFIGSDYACAKYLGWRVTTLHKISQEEKAKGEAYKEMERNEAERMQIEAEADAHIRDIERDVESKERNAQMAAGVQTIISESATKFLGQFTGALDGVMQTVLENANQQLSPPETHKELKAPDTNDL